MLTAMPSDGTVISVDSSAAMQRAGQRWLSDSRLTWVTAAAEALTGHVSGPADAVICNSAIWKTNTAAVFTAVKDVLRPGGQFVFNVGGGFAGLPRPGPRQMPSLTDLIDSIAARDYGYLPHEQDPRPALTADILISQLTEAGFTAITHDTITYQGTVEEKRAWLSIPVFARPPGNFTHDQRMAILREAFDRADKTAPSTTGWLIITAQA